MVHRFLLTMGTGIINASYRVSSYRYITMKNQSVTDWCSGESQGWKNPGLKKVFRF